MTDVILHIVRRDAPNAAPRTEHFRVPFRPRMTVLSCLLEIGRRPVDARGAAVAPLSFEGDCMEEACGACAMSINGWPMQACSALVEELEQPIVVAPLEKFPVQRDLAVDRARLVAARVRMGSAHQLDAMEGEAPRAPADALELQALSTCTQCGACLQACPNVKDGGGFVGAAVVHEAEVLHAHPLARLQGAARLAALSAPGGVGDCGNAQVCEAVCPVQLPLTGSLSRVGGRVSWLALRQWTGQAKS